MLKIGSQDAFSDCISDFLLCPEAASIKFLLAGGNNSVIYRTVHIDKFTFTLAVKHIAPQYDWFELRDAQFFLDLSS